MNTSSDDWQSAWVAIMVLVERITELSARAERYLSALEHEALYQANSKFGKSSDAVGSMVVVGDMVFDIGCDEHANMIATERP